MIPTRTLGRPATRGAKTLAADVCVVGAGIAGVSAALEAAKLGRTVVLVDAAPALGGQAVGSIIGTIIGLYTHEPPSLPDHPRCRRRPDQLDGGKLTQWPRVDDLDDHVSICHTGKSFETTPDGREGWDTIFVRAGHPVYIVDATYRGRSPVSQESLMAVKSGDAAPSTLPTLLTCDEELAAPRVGGFRLRNSNFPIDVEPGSPREAVRRA